MTRFVEVVGLQDLARLSRAMRAAGEQGKGLKRELRSSLVRETKQTRADMRKAILPGLPRSGGLAADVQRSTRFTAKVSTGANPAVRIQARGQRSIRRMNNAGSVRHRVFGRDVWVTQTAGIQKGFLDKPFEEARPDLQRAVVRAIGRIRSQIYRSV